MIVIILTALVAAIAGVFIGTGMAMSTIDQKSDKYGYYDYRDRRYYSAKRNPGEKGDR